MILSERPKSSFPRRLAAGVCGHAIRLFARLVTAVRPVWQGIDPAQGGQRIYFANHASHGDFILIWSTLPERQRRATRPVAGADYWGKGGLRSFIGRDVFHSLLIDRQRNEAVRTDPVGQMAAALDRGSSLILFPEGTRNTTDEILLPLKSGLFHLASARPDVDLVPVWIDNLNRVLPKGAVIPVPLMCKVLYGAPMRLQPDETKAAFLDRARQAMLDLRQDANDKGEERA